MMTTKTAPYDVAEFLETSEEMAAYLDACMEVADADSAFIAKVLADIARAKGMTQIARKTGLSRKIYIKFSLEISVQTLILSEKLLQRWASN